MQSANLYLTNAEDVYVWIHAENQLAVFGLDAMDLLGRKVWDVWPSEYVEHYRRLHEKTKADGRTRVFLTPHATDPFCWLQITLFSTTGGILCVSTEIRNPSPEMMARALGAEGKAGDDPLRRFFRRYLDGSPSLSPGSESNVGGS